MNILVLTLNYIPDLSAGSFRVTALVEALRQAPQCSVDVVTALPNRYSGFCPKIQEDPEGFNIHRIALPQHKGTLISQVRAYRHFIAGVLDYTKNKHYNCVVASSSRLMTAVLGAIIAKKTRAKLYLDIRDIFAESLPDVLPLKLGYALKPLLSCLERWAIGRADRVNLVSEGFLEYFQKRYPKRSFTCWTNGVDSEFCSLSSKQPGPILNILYAGNIGLAQGLHLIVPQLAKRLEHRARFTLIGSGNGLRKLTRELEKQRVDNVDLLPPQERKTLVESYENADILFLHLTTQKAFLKVLPSKLFEYAATGKPIWAGLAGYAARFVSSQIENAALFDPENVEQALSALDRLNRESTPRTDFVARYSRETLSRQIAKDIIDVAKQSV
ncbi:MAG TPA: glycosyltransferase WbuB [Opitutae bacterium]|nr:glycosyltransferase WbuB [Opitutae bacterium]